MQKKFKVTFLLDKSNMWFAKQLKSYDFKLKKKFIFKISKNVNKVKNQNIVFPLSYTKILPESFLQKNELVLITHTSKLPHDKGFASLQNQVLRNKKKCYISLMKAVKEVDAGPIYYQDSFMMDGTELLDEIRYIQGLQILKIIHKFLINYPNVKSKKQSNTIKGNFNKRRHPKDSELNINKTIKQQINYLRINDNKHYPSFFYFKNKKYIIHIFKDKK